MTTSAIRSRWAAVGAAVAITLGGGGIGLVSATSPADAVAYVPIEPCRIADTRPDLAFNVGPRNTPIGADEIHVITAHGNNGECTGIPTSATGLQLNVTALNASQNTFVTVWGQGTRPNASSLNPALGQPPAPNAVTTGLSDTGTFNVFNRFGTVDVIADVVGYYTDHDHGDDNGEAAGSNDQSNSLSGTAAVITSITIDTPSVGYLTINASTSGFGLGGDGQVRCSITTGTGIEGGAVFLSAVVASNWTSLSGTRSFQFGTTPISGETTVNLVCDGNGGPSLGNSHLTGIFTPDPDAAFVLVAP